MNIFYGAGVPACLLILGKNRPKDRRDKLLLVYAARHYRELSSKNQLRPQDVMRILVHYHAYGDAKKAAKQVQAHSTRLRALVDRQAVEDVVRITAEYILRDDALLAAKAALAAAVSKPDLLRWTRSVEKLRKELAERDERIAEVRKQADEEKQAIETVGRELIALYADPAELAKHARVVEIAEIEENEYNLNIPRYVDTFEPEEVIDVATALKELDVAEVARQTAERQLRELLKEVGYGY